MRTPLLLRAAIVAAAPALALTGCTTEVSVPADKVASQISGALAPQLGFTPEASCPENLPAEVGATITCTLVFEDGSEHDAKVTVTGVDGLDVDFDINVESK